jgi:FkbM family methyltransferase
MNDSCIKEKLFRIMLYLRSTTLGTAIYCLLDDIGIRIAISRFFNYMEGFRKTKSEEIKKSYEFYNNNIERIENVVSLLNDEESKEVYKSIWKFRCTGNYSDLPNNSYRSQYFQNNFFKYNETETLIDCGAFDGDTVRSFKKIARRKGISDYRIIAFEPDYHNYINLVRNHPDVLAKNAGCWDKNEKLTFRSDRYESRIDLQNPNDNDNSIETIECVRIDDIEECATASFIKMDIEGAERNALSGAYNTIKNNMPKLAICIYHSDDDMVELPLMIHEMIPGYKMYIRHHSNSRGETVLYCAPY